MAGRTCRNRDPTNKQSDDAVPQARSYSPHQSSIHHTFLSWDGETIASLKEASALFMSLVELVKDEVTMTLAQQEDAVFLLEVLRPGYQTLLTEDEVLKSLAPSPKGSIQGLCDSICILLTSFNQNIVENAMQIFRRIFISQPFPIKRQLMETNIIAEILALLKGPTLPVPHKEIMSTHLLAVIPFLLRIGLPQWMKTLNLPTRSDQIPVRDTVLQHVVLPSKWYLRELLVNRYSITKSEDLKNFVNFEIDLALTSVYYPPMFAVVMELSLPAFLTSTLAFVEADNAISRVIINLSFTVKDWQNKAGDDYNYFDCLLMCLSVEGIEDEIEQLTATDGVDYAKDISNYSENFIWGRGGNLPLNADPD
ncbi:hypothetical protein BLNAU_9999 [Blattamonas nauphoetae]|uniref:Uncharacterized protein n=1 Tax=Blattamonas nauphoetae TaxID=2049346 RepID=A0ABQ9XUC1_9EUKA|nr:hypothetical protein BLNAU_9999 [Blattamonas nauphoetae]